MIAVRRGYGIVLLLSMAISFSIVSCTPRTVSAAASVGISHVDPSAYPHVTFQLHVTDPSGLSPTALTMSEFRVTDNGVPVSSLSARLVRKGQRGTDVLLLIDTGPSSHGAQINASQSASQSFISGIGSTDKVAVTFFDKVTHPLTPFTSDKATLTAALGKLVVAKGQSRIYDSLYTSLERLNQPHQRYAVILITDGADVHSRHTQAQCVTLARKRGVVVYTVALGTTPVLKVLRGLAVGSGGQMFTASSTAQLQSIYRRLVLVFRHDYSLNYTATSIGHRGQQARLQVRYTPPGAAPITSSVTYSIPTAPWLHLTKTPSALGIVENPHHIVVPVTFTSEDNVAHHVTVSVSGWTGMTVTPSVLTVRPYKTVTHANLILAAQSVPTGGLRGSLTLHVGSTPGTLLDRHMAAMSYRLLPSLLRVSGVPADLGNVSDLASGHPLTVTVGSTVFHPTTLAVRVVGGNAIPPVLHIASAKERFTSSETLRIRVPNVPAGQHGVLHIAFVPLQRGVRVSGGTATAAYYVPTWLESNWKWLVPTLLLIAIALYVLIAFGWEHLTRNWDTRQRAIVGR